MSISPRDTVAVIEDDPAARASLVAIINSLGMDTYQSASAEEYLQQQFDALPSCLVLDFCLPGMSGLDFLSQYGADDATPPVIIVTGFATIPLAVKMMRDGAFTVLEKPCAAHELKSAIQSAVERHHLVQQRRNEDRELRARFDALTDIEQHVVRGIVAGTSNSQLAESLNIGLRTVEKRRQQVYRKLKVDNLPAFIQLLYRIDPEMIHSLSFDENDPEDEA